jgi:large subunit ribosomal protein L14
MIQNGTLLNVIDNSGARTALCLKVFPGYKRRYANIGDILLVSIKTLRSKRRDSLKVKKGELYRALVLKVKVPVKGFSGDSFFYVGKSSVILLNKQNKFLGTRVLSSVSKLFRFTKYLKMLSLSFGVHSV